MTMLVCLVVYVVEVRPLEPGNFAVVRNGGDISGNLTTVNDTVMDLSVQITRTGVNMVESVFASGIRVTVKVTEGIPNFVVSLPVAFQNNTIGLLGNYNGDKTDDFISRNGTSLSDNSTDSEIHEFGQSCEFFCTYVTLGI